MWRQAAEKVNPNLDRTVVILTKLDLSREAQVRGWLMHVVTRCSTTGGLGFVGAVLFI